MSTKGLLSDSHSRIVYWSTSQEELKRVVFDVLLECKQAVNIRAPQELHFSFCIYFFCDICIPDDANCTLDVQRHPEFPTVSVFEVHVCMGLVRWQEFKQGATLMIRQLCRSVMPDAEAQVMKGFNIAPFEDHVNVTGLDGVFEKTKNYK